MNEIGGKTRVLGVIGNPVEHTVSPVIHNNLAGILGDDIVYAAFHVMNENLEEAIKGAYALDLLGLNVTVPHKENVIKCLKDIDPLAERIGAVNTLVRCEGGFKGYNTDMPGLLRAMKHDGVCFDGKEVIILGAGGVARAVAMMLAENNAGHIYIMNRTLSKARDIADEINAYKQGMITALSLDDHGSLDKSRKYIVIQATSVGMHPNTEAAVIEDPSFYELVKAGYDIVFNPLVTKFMKLCREAGASAFSGLRMLLYQGVIAYELWTGKEVSEENAEKIYEKMLEAMNG